MVERGYRVTFVTYGDERDTKYKRVLGNISIIPLYKYFRRPRNRYLRLLHSLALPIKLKSIFKSADIYKTNQMYGSWVALVGKSLHKKPLIVRCGYEWYRNVLRNEEDKIKKCLLFIVGYLYELFSYLMADQIIISNHSDRNFIKKFFVVRRKKIKVIRNPIDTSVFAPGKNEKRGLANNKRMLFVGRLVKQKNLDNVIKAIGNTEYGLDIIGNGEEKRNLVERASRTNADVRFFGVVPNDKLPEVMNQYSVFILASYFENNPKALMEAMACGLAIVVSNIEGINELVRHEVNGLLCGTDAQSIGETVHRIFKDEKLRQRLGKAARATAVNDFNIQSVLEKELSIYKTIIRQRNL